MAKRQTQSYFTIIIWVLFGVVPVLTEAELGCKMWSGLSCSYALLGHGSVPTVCTGKGQAYVTPHFLASCGKPCPKLFDAQTGSCLLLLCQIREVRLPRSGRRSQKEVGGQLWFSDRTLQILHPLGRFASSWGTMASSWRAEEQVVPGMDVVPWARSPPHRQSG